MRFIIIILINLTLFISCTVMKQTKDKAYERIEEDSSMILNTKRFGSVEYVINNNENPPVLIIHGIVGGYDQGIQTAQNLLPEKQKYFSISLIACG